MTEIRLVKPTIRHADAIMALRQELLGDKTGDRFAGCGNLEHCETAEAWLSTIEKLSSEMTCPLDRVPSDTYLAIRQTDGVIVGVIDFRHHINHPILALWGGHTGYIVRPSERGKGYAKEMLRQNLQKAWEQGYDRILITCAANNPASEKTILVNGGIYETDVPVDGEFVKRYWIKNLKAE